MLTLDTVAPLCAAVRATYDHDGRVLDIAANEAAEAALSRAISVPTGWGSLGVFARDPSGILQCYSEARAEWMRATYTPREA